MADFRQLPSLLFPHGVALEGDLVAVVEKPVEDGVRERGMSDGVVPFLDGELPGHDRGFSAVAVFEDLEQIASLLVGERRHGPVIEEKEIDACEGIEEFGVSAVAATQPQVFEQARETEVGDAEALAARLVPQGARQERFPDPRGAGDEDVQVLLDEGVSLST